MLKHLDLFSGIGGFSLGLESTGGFETITFVEKDNFCQKVLKKHWPNTNIEGDIRNVKGDRYEADVITGGFPCQPFSVAGKRKGTDDDRYLWDETIRVVRECKPRWFIGENVEGLININNGMVLRQVQTDLEKEGFEVQCLVIPAAGIGAWHMRKRIWIMAYSNSNGHRNKIGKGNGEKEKIQDQYRKNDSTSRKSSGTSSIRETDIEYVPNSNNTGDRTSQYDINGTGEKINKGQKEFLQSEFSRHRKNVPNSIGFELHGRNDAPRISGTEQHRLDSNQKEDWKKVWGKTERCGEQDTLRNVSNSKSFKSNDGKHGNNCKEEQVQFKTGRKNSNGNVSNSNNERLERHNGDSSSVKTSEKQTNFGTENCSQQFTEQQTWWQTQSRICGIPNGISFGLDKDRNNRIKALGNSIVPQIARELGLAIMKAEVNK